MAKISSPKQDDVEGLACRARLFGSHFGHKIQPLTTRSNQHNNHNKKFTSLPSHQNNNLDVHRHQTNLSVAKRILVVFPYEQQQQQSERQQPIGGCFP